MDHITKNISQYYSSIVDQNFSTDLFDVIKTSRELTVLMYINNIHDEICNYIKSNNIDLYCQILSPILSSVNLVKPQLRRNTITNYYQVIKGILTCFNLDIDTILNNIISTYLNSINYHIELVDYRIYPRTTPVPTMVFKLHDKKNQSISYELKNSGGLYYDNEIMKFYIINNHVRIYEDSFVKCSWKPFKKVSFADIYNRSNSHLTYTKYPIPNELYDKIDKLYQSDNFNLIDKILKSRKLNG